MASVARLPSQAGGMDFNSSFVSTASFAKIGPFARWELDTTSCGVCRDTFTPFRRAHHCRMCGTCVCSACSGSSIQIKGYVQPQRCCINCTQEIVLASETKERIAKLCNRLCSLSEKSGALHQTTPQNPKDWDLEQAIALCEASLLGVEDSYAVLIVRAEEAEREVKVERGARERLEQQLTEALSIALCKKPDCAGEKTSMNSLGRVLSDTISTCPTGQTSGESFVLDSDVDSDSDADSDCDSDSSPSSALTGCGAGCAPPSAWPENTPGRVLKITPISELEAPPADTGSTVDSDGSDDDTFSVGTIPPRLGQSLCTTMDDWDANTAHCALCDLKLGKRFLRRRHHCRMCGKCVCGSCSRSRASIEAGDGPPLRVCTTCVQSAPVKPVVPPLRFQERLKQRFAAVEQGPAAVQQRNPFASHYCPLPPHRTSASIPSMVPPAPLSHR